MNSESVIKFGIFSTGLVFIIALGYFIFFYRLSIANPGYVIGTFVKYKQSRGGPSAVFKYEIDGNAYHVESGRNETLTTSDKMIICYDKTNPSDAMVLADKIVFIKGEKTGIANGKIIKVRDFTILNTNQIYYEYNVKGLKYKRMQDFPMNINLKKLDVSANYKVTYWEDNPQRSKIDL